MALNQGSCRCGRRLYVPAEMARGTCNKCHLAEQVMSQPKVMSHTPKKVMSQDGMTKQARWDKAHQVQRRMIHRLGQQRRRA